MSPILLERTDFIKVGITATILLPTLFMSGFIFGYTKAEDHQIRQLAQIAIELPDVAEPELAAFEPVVPAQQAPGLDRDVDLADTVTVDEAMQHQHTSVAHADEVKPPAVNEMPDIASTTQTVTPTDVVATEITETKPAVLAIGGPHEPIEQDPAELVLDTSDEASARYTVQVGLFGNEDNAERKVESMMSMRLNAYTTEFTNSKDKQLFNVRFGYFDTKKNALAALSSYQSLFSSDGYLVRINR